MEFIIGDLMVANFSVLGCCASRDIFNSSINKDYKKYFSISDDIMECSIISLMQKPIDYDKNNTIYNPPNRYKTSVIQKDLEKTFLDNLIESNVKYLILDNYYEMKFGILFYKNNIITNNWWSWPDSPFLEEISSCKGLAPLEVGLFNRDNVTINFDKYFKIWSVCVDKFFNILNEKRPDIKIILNPVRNSFDVTRENGSVYSVDNDLKKLLSDENDCISKFDDHICNNYDVEILNHNYYNAIEHGYWSFNYVHYEYAYYDEINKLLMYIVNKYSNRYLLNKYEELYKNSGSLLSFNNFLIQNSVEIIKDSNMFDEEFYSNTYFISNQDLISHYVNLGIYEGCNPNSWFDFEEYANKNDLNGLNPFVHFLIYNCV